MQNGLCVPQISGLGHVASICLIIVVISPCLLFAPSSALLPFLGGRVPLLK